MGLHPCEIVDHPKGKWNNFSHCKYAFHVFYCYFEGYTRSQDAAHEALIYIFHGETAKVAKKSGLKRYEIIHHIHKSMQQGRFRFRKHVQTCFAEFLQHIEQNPNDKALLTDKGAANASPAYLAAVENGLREMAIRHPRAMGRGSIKTPSAWTKSAYWRKRECYVNLGRLVLIRDALKTWRKFLYKDFVELKRLDVTFKKRHAHLSTGEGHQNISGIRDPDDWSDIQVTKEPANITKQPADRHTPTTNANTAIELWDTSDDDDADAAAAPHANASQAAAVLPAKSASQVAAALPAKNASQVPAVLPDTTTSAPQKITPRKRPRKPNSTAPKEVAARPEPTSTSSHRKRRKTSSSVQSRRSSPRKKPNRPRRKKR